MFGCLRWKDVVYQITSRETHLGKYIIFKKYFIKMYNNTFDDIWEKILCWRVRGMLSCLGSIMRLRDVARFNSAVKMGNASAEKFKAIQSKDTSRQAFWWQDMLWKSIQGTLKNILHEDSITSTYVSLGLSIYISGTVPSILRNSDLGIIPLDFWRPEPSPLSKSPQVY